MRRDEIRQPIGHRRVDRVSGGLGIGPLQRRSLGRALVLGVDALGERDHLGEDLDLLLDPRTIAEDHVDDLVEVEQPERQLDVARIEHQGAVAEAAAVLVVAVEQEEAQVRPRIEDLLQDHDDAARLADAGGAEHGEVLAQHVVDVDIGADAGILQQRSDVDRVRSGQIVDEAQLAVGNQRRRIADRRIGGDAALEIRGIVGTPPDLAHQVELGGRVIALLAGDRDGGERHLGDHRDQQRGPAAQHHELPDRDPRFGALGFARCEHAHARLRPGDGEHVSQCFGA